MVAVPHAFAAPTTAYIPLVQVPHSLHFHGFSAVSHFPVPCCHCSAFFFVQRNMVREGTAFLLDALAGDKPEEGPLQTKLLEINLVTNPQVGAC